MGIRGHDQPPVLVAPTGVVEQERLRMMEQKDPAEHVAVAHIAHTFRMAAGVSHGQAEMMIPITLVLRHTRLCARKNKNA